MKKILLIVICVLFSHNLDANRFFPWLYNAILLIDNHNMSDYFKAIDNSLMSLATAIDQKVVPIIVSSNILHSLLWRRRVWSSNRKKPNSLEETTEHYVLKWRKVIVDLKNKHANSQSVDLLAPADNELAIATNDFMESVQRNLNAPQLGFRILYLLIDNYFTAEIVFSEAEWDIYQSRAEDWYVLIPKAYMQTVRKKWNAQKLGKTLQSYKKNLQVSADKTIDRTEKAELQKELQAIENQLAILSDPKKLDAYLLGLNIHRDTLLMRTTLAQLTDNLTDSNMIKKLNFDNLMNLFITKNESAFGSWIIYLAGHGKYSLGGYENELKILNKQLSEIKNLQEYFKRNRSKFEKTKGTTISIAGQADQSSIEAAFKYFDMQSKEIETKINKLLMPEIRTLTLKKELDPDAMVAGLPIKNFMQLLDFLNDVVFTKFLFYTTCFGGGYNLIQPFKKFFSTLIEEFEDASKKLIYVKPLNFTIAVASTTDDIVSQYSQAGLMATSLYRFLNLIESLPAHWRYFHRSNSSIELLPATVDFVNFFHQSDLYFTNPSRDTSLEKILISGNINLVLLSTADVVVLSSFPSVLFPGTSFFQSISIDNEIQRLTYALVTARLLEKKPLLIDKVAALIYPSEIPIIVQLKKNKKQITPRLIPMAQGPGIYYVQELDAPSIGLEDLLKESFFIFRYKSSKLFFIKKLITKQGIYNSVLINVQENRNEFLGASAIHNKFYAGKWTDLSQLTNQVQIKDITLEEATYRGLELMHDWHKRAKGYSLVAAPWLIDNDVLVEKIKEEFLAQFKTQSC